MIFDLSRLVHDLLDVARAAGSGRLRQAQAIGRTYDLTATPSRCDRSDCRPSCR
jgi:hypothetical protein